MRKIRKLGPLVLLICLSSCASSCRNFDWTPRPYVGDSINSQLINVQGETILCSQPEFDRMTCFDEENIAELKTAIDQVSNKKVRQKLKSLLIKVQEKPLLKSF